jgi:hypothetical protein
MEMLENFVPVSNITLDQYSTQVEKINCRTLSIYEHYRLFKIGYLHGDFHESNAMFIRPYVYIDGFNGRVMLIDFGATFKHNLPIPSNLTLHQFINIMLDNSSPKWSFDGVPFNNREFENYFWIEDFKKFMSDNPLDDLDALREITLNEFNRELHNLFPDFNIQNVITNNQFIGGRYDNKSYDNKVYINHTNLNSNIGNIGNIGNKYIETKNLFNFSNAKNFFKKENITLQQAVSNENNIQKEILNNLTEKRSIQWWM